MKNDEDKKLEVLILKTISDYHEFHRLPPFEAFPAEEHKGRCLYAGRMFTVLNSKIKKLEEQIQSSKPTRNPAEVREKIIERDRETLEAMNEGSKKVRG